VTGDSNATDTKIEYKRNEVSSYMDQMIDGKRIDFRRVKYIHFAELTPE
jgi:hypothetical protein